jgi:spore coat polysaccharide biosynthesis predicted glycosyltransferase SpsG
LSIHDLGLNPLPSDVVIDGSIFPAMQDFPRRDTSFYTGTAYLVLDPAFGLIHQQRKRIRPNIQSVVVNLGGGDSSRFFETVLQGLRTLGRDLEVVGLRGFSDWGQERLTVQDLTPVRFRWALPGESVERLLFRADAAVTAGGLAAFEALCAGTPLLSLSFDGFQSFTISMLAKADACIDLGRGDHLKAAAIPAVLNSLNEDPARRERMSLNGRQIVDGRGAERVSRVIRRLVGAGAAEAQPMVV